MGNRLSKASAIICYLVLVLWAVITIYPLVYTLLSSMKNQTEMFSNLFGMPVVFRTENYSQLFTDMKFGRNILNSFILAFVTIFFQLLFGSMASYIMSHFESVWKNRIMVFFVLGMLIPIHAIIIPISTIAKTINGFNSFPFIISVYIACGIPYMVFVITGFMSGIPKELLEAGIVDGCSGGTAFWRIILPLSRPALATMGMLSFISTWNELILALILLKANAVKTVSLALTLFAGERFSNYPGMCAAVIVGVLPTMIIYFIFQENIIKGMTAGAVKG